MHYQFDLLGRSLPICMHAFILRYILTKHKISINQMHAIYGAVCALFKRLFDMSGFVSLFEYADFSLRSITVHKHRHWCFVCACVRVLAIHMNRGNCQYHKNHTQWIGVCNEWEIWKWRRFELIIILQFSCMHACHRCLSHSFEQNKYKETSKYDLYETKHNIHIKKKKKIWYRIYKKLWWWYVFAQATDPY